MINSKPIQLLVDRRSTLTFINARSKTLWYFPPQNQPAPNNGNQQTKHAETVEDPAFEQETMKGMLYDSFRAIELGSQDTILRTDWMKKYNPVSFDFLHMQASITKGSQKVLIQGVTGRKDVESFSPKRLPSVMHKE